MAGKKKTPKKTTGVATTAKRVQRIEDRVDTLHGRFDRLSTLVISQFTSTNGTINDLGEVIEEKFDNHLSVHEKLDKKIGRYVLLGAGLITCGVLLNRPELMINLFTVLARLF